MTDTAAHDTMLHLPGTAMPALHRVLARDRQPADAADLARQLGFQTGEGFLNAFREWLEHQKQEAGVNPSALVADEFWQRLSGFFLSLGWGRLEFEPLHHGVAALSSAQWAEAEPGAGARQPTCHFTTGMLADFLGRLAGGELAVMEVECSSRGDERCRFLFGSVEALERVYARLQDGAPLEAALTELD